MILAGGLLVMANGFAMDVAIENPYKDIEVIIKSRYTPDKKSCKKDKKGKKKCSFKSYSKRDSKTTYQFSGNRELQLLQATGIDVAIFLRANNQILPEQSYDAVTKSTPHGSKFKQFFALDGKEGKIYYKVDVKMDSKRQEIESLKIKVLDAKLDGKKFDKNKK